MNRTDFLNMIGNNGPVDRQMIGEVYELVDLFPYFQSAHMLLLKGLQNNDDVKFESQLKKSAIHIADREVLYYLLKTPVSLEAKIPGDEKIVVYSEEPAYDNQQNVIETAKNSELLIDELERDSGSTVSEDLSDPGHMQPGHSILLSSESEDDYSPGVIMMVDDEEVLEEENVFFMDPGFSAPAEEDLLELDLDESREISSEESTESLSKPDADAKTQDKKLKSELIDRFIIANPRIETNKDKTLLPAEDLSKPYTEVEGGFVTETLARIYISQGYYSKAIDIYEKLSLKFPEKSSYFAFQIEKVKEYLKK